MQFSEDILIQIMILVLGICGFLVAKHIHDHKKKNTPLVCPVGFDCNAVVHSDYSKFLGLPVEIFGMIYYALLSFAYLIFIFVTMPASISVYFSYSLIFMSLMAFLFSLYLIGVQIFILKKGCSWCIVSALISALIFILAILS